MTNGDINTMHKIVHMVIMMLLEFLVFVDGCFKIIEFWLRGGVSLEESGFIG